jgi:hypothetical protein
LQPWADQFFGFPRRGTHPLKSGTWSLFEHSKDLLSLKARGFRLSWRPPPEHPLTLEMAGFGFHDSEPESLTTPATLVGYARLWWGPNVGPPGFTSNFGPQAMVYKGF